MAVENGVFVSQKFLINIDENFKHNLENYTGNRINSFIKSTLNSNTFYRYYPTPEMIKEIKKIKLYDELVVKDILLGIYDKDSIKIFESDTLVKAVNGNDIILKAEKKNVR